MDHLRIVTLNLWNDRQFPERRLEVVAEGLRALEPDMVALQEVREGPLYAQATSLGRMLQMYFVFGSVDPHSNGGPIGNSVLSRFPIHLAKNIRLPSPPDDPRGAIKVSIHTPAGDVQLTNCHLSWHPCHAAYREAQVLAVDDLCQAPESVHSVLAGDFNMSPEAHAIRFLIGLDSLAGRGTFFRDAWGRRHPHEDGYTWSSSNPCAVRRIEQDRRIDYIFVKGPVTPRGERIVEDARVVLNTPASDDTWPSDHYGVFAIIRLT